MLFKYNLYMHWVNYLFLYNGSNTMYYSMKKILREASKKSDEKFTLFISIWSEENQNYLFKSM